MKLYIWTIIAFQRTDENNTHFRDGLFYTWANDKESVEREVSDRMAELFPESDGWFEHNWLIDEVPNAKQVDD